MLVADDHPVVREGMLRILERQPDVSVIGSVGTASDAISEAARLKPRILVMDITMPGMNGIEATRVLAEQVPGTAVIILSMHSSPIIVRRAVQSGARGYLSKDTSPEELLRAVRAVAAGKRYVSQGLVQILLEVPASSRSDLDALLTTTERNILKLVAEGRSNAQVAAVIGLSARTVETYRLRLMRKLGLDNLPSLVRYAIRHGIIALE